MSKEWRCFHCDEVFTNLEDARAHFGDSQLSNTACQINIEYVRDMELQLARYHAEDSDSDRAIYRMQADHDAALKKEEEKGYRRGLVDQVFNNG